MTPEELREFLAAKFAKWQLPDAFVFTRRASAHIGGQAAEELKLRETYADWNWET